MMNHLKYRETLGLVMLTLAIALAICGLRRTSPFAAYVELPVYDFLTEKFEPWKTGHPSIALVTMSEEPFWRGLNDRNLAELIGKISNAEASVVAVDLIRDNPLPPGSEALQQAVTDEAGADVFMVAGLPGAGKTGFLPPPFLRDPEAVLDHVGLAVMPYDAPGRPMIRRGLVAVNDGAMISLPAQSAIAHLARTHPEKLEDIYTRLSEISDLPPTAGGYAQAATGGNQFLLKPGPDLASAFPKIPAESVGTMDENSLRDALGGKIVFIGTEANLSQDEKPVVGNPELRGVILLATATAQLLRELDQGEEPVRWIPDYQEDSLVLLSVLLIVVPFRIFRTKRLFHFLLLGATLGVAWLLGGGLFLKSGTWIPVGAPVAATVLSATGCYAYAFLSITNLFRRFRGREVADAIMASSGHKDKEHVIQATALFADLKGYSGISESFRASGREADLLPWLKRYMEAMISIVNRERGFIEQFSGDGIFVVFGFPDKSDTNHAASAVRCALAISATVDQLNRTVPESLPNYYARIGIYTGPINCGTIGDDRQMNFSFLGTTVNKASRLESFDKGAHDHLDQAVRILASEPTRVAADGVAEFQRIQNGPSMIDPTLPPEVIWKVFPPGSAIPEDPYVIQP